MMEMCLCYKQKCETTHRTPEVCRQDLFTLHMLFESPPGLLQSGFMPRFTQLPQHQTPQQGVQMP